MKFHVRLYHKRISDDELLADIRRSAKTLKKIKLSCDEYNRHGKYSAVTAKKRFGSWAEAVKKAGLIPYSLNLTAKELFVNLERTWRKLGRQPASKEMKKESLCSSRPYEKCFGSWNKALMAFDKYIKSGRKDYPKTEKSGREPSPLNHRKRRRTKRKIPFQLRYKVLKRDKYKCRCCGSSPSDDKRVKLHIDHIKPWSQGGESVMGNLQTLCRECNLGKGSLSN